MSFCCYLQIPSTSDCFRRLPPAAVLGLGVSHLTPCVGMMTWGGISRNPAGPGGDFGLNYAYSREVYAIFLSPSAPVGVHRLQPASVLCRFGFIHLPHWVGMAMWGDHFEKPNMDGGDSGID